MAPDYFDSSVEFPELDPLTGLPVGTKGNAEGARTVSSFSDEDWEKFLNDGASALNSGTFVNPMDIATQEENKKLRSQIEELRAESERAQSEFHAQQDRYVEVLRQLNEKNKEALEEQRIQHEKQMAEMNSHFEALQNASRNAGEMETELRDQIERLRSEKEELQRQTEILRHEAETQQKRYAEEKERAEADLERTREEARQNEARLSAEATSRENKLEEERAAEKERLLREINEIREKARLDAEAQSAEFKSRLAEELGRKDSEMTSRLEAAEEEKRQILVAADDEKNALREEAQRTQNVLKEKAEQDQATLRERASARINEIIAANTQLQDKEKQLTKDLEESNKNYEALAEALRDTREKLEYSESEQAKRDLEAARMRLEEEASLRDQKISEAKALIQQQWSKLQQDRETLSAERDAVAQQRADAEEEKRRAVAWQQSTLSERLKLQDAQKKLAADQEDADLLRAKLEKLRADVQSGLEKLNADREAYEKRVAEETAERQGQIAAARTFLEKMHKESEEERANVMMERLSFEKEKEDALRQLETDRNEFEERKNRFRKELDLLTSWSGFRSDVEEPVKEEAPQETAAAEETSAEPVPAEAPEDERLSAKDFFRDDPVEELYSAEALPSQDRSVDDTSVDDNSVMASPFADLFMEPSLTEALFPAIAGAARREEPVKEEKEPEEEHEEVILAPKEDAVLEETSDIRERSEADDSAAVKTEPETASAEEEYPEETAAVREEPQQEEEPAAVEEPVNGEIIPEPEDHTTDAPEEKQENSVPESDAVPEKEETEVSSDSVTGENDNLSTLLAAEIEQKVSELMDTVSRSEENAPEAEKDHTGNLFDTLTDVSVRGFAAEPEEKEDFSLMFHGTEKAEEPASDVGEETFSTEPFDFDSVTDTLNLAMLEKDEYSFTENNLMTEGEVCLIAENLNAKYYINGDNYSYPAFRDANFVCPSQSCTAVVSDVPFCGYAMLRAVVLPTELAGGAVYVDGHQIQKEDCIYIGSDRILSKQQTVMEWLVDNTGGKVSERKKHYQETLEEIGISKWAKRSLKALSYSRRILVLLLACEAHDAKIVVLNDPHFSIDPKDEMVARRIFKHLHDSGKTVLMSSSDLFTLQSVASRVIILKNGSISYSGSYRDFLKAFSGVAVSMPGQYGEAVEAAAKSDGRFDFSSEGDECMLILKKGVRGTTADAFALLESAGVPTESIRNTEKTFALACREAF